MILTSKVKKKSLKLILTVFSYLNVSLLCPPLKAMEKGAEICDYSITETHVAIKGHGYFLVSDTADEDEKELSLSPIGTWEEDKKGYFRNHIGQYLNVVYLDDDGLPLIKGSDLNAVLKWLLLKAYPIALSPPQGLAFRGYFQQTLQYEYRIIPVRQLLTHWEYSMHLIFILLVHQMEHYDGYLG